MSDKRKSPATPKGYKQPADAVQSTTAEARRLAIAILETLAGVRTPTEAATAAGVSLPRYYQLERRALEGLVAACEPRPKGKQTTPELKIALLERQLEQTRRECARGQALVRAAERTVGLRASSAASAAKKNGAADRRGKQQKRRPTVRALKSIEALKTDVASETEGGVQQPAVKSPRQVPEENTGSC